MRLVILVLILGVGSSAFAKNRVDTLSLRDLDGLFGAARQPVIAPGAPASIACHIQLLQSQNGGWGRKQWESLEHLYAATDKLDLSAFLDMNSQPQPRQIAFGAAFCYGLTGPGQPIEGHPTLVVKDENNRILAIGMVRLPEVDEAAGEILSLLVHRDFSHRPAALQKMLFQAVVGSHVWTNPARNPAPGAEVQLLGHAEVDSLKGATLRRLGFKAKQTYFRGDREITRWEYVAPAQR